MKKLSALFLSLIMILSCLCVFAVAEEEAEVKIPVYKIDPEYFYEGCVAIYTPKRGEKLGIEGQTFAWWTVLVFEADEASGGYKCISVGAADGTDKTNTAIPANGFVIGANGGNNWPDLFKTATESDWFYNASNDEGIPYKDCPNYQTEAIKAIVDIVKAVKVGDIFYLDGVSIENANISTNESETVHYYDDGFKSYSFLTSVKPTSSTVSEDPSEPASEPASETTSTAASETASVESSEKPVVPTSDSGIAALAVISVLAVAGAVIVKKSR